MIARIIRNYYQWDEFAQKRILYFVLRTQDGRKVTKRIFDSDDANRPYAYFEPEYAEDVKTIVSSLTTDFEISLVDDVKLHVPESENKKNAAIVRLQNPKHIGILRAGLEKKGIWTWEAKTLYMERLAIDNGYKNIVRIDNGLPEAVDENKYDIPIKKMPWDIEVYDKGGGGTLATRDKILSIAAGDKYFSGDEETLIRDFLKYSDGFDVSYSWSSYDIDYMIERCQALRIKLSPEFMSSNIDLLDRYRFRLGRQLESNALANVAKFEGLPVKIQRPGKVADMSASDLREYNMRDTEILKWIEDGYQDGKDMKGRRRYVSLEQEMADLAGFHISFAHQEVKLWETIYLRELQKLGKKRVALPTSGMKLSRREDLVGGWVRTPPPGVKKWVISSDFVGLYATLIMNLNTCPLGLGIMSQKVKEYMRLRNEIRAQMKKEKDENKRQELNQRQLAMKLVCNSGLGVVGYEGYGAGSLFSTKHFNEVTTKGRDINERSGEFLEKLGGRIYYGDTDSIFYSPPRRNIKKWKAKKNIRKALIAYGKKNDKKLNKFLKKDGVEIESKEVYRELLFFAKKGDKRGAKKVYAGRQIYADDKVIKKPKYYSRGLEKANYTIATKEVFRDAVVFALKGDIEGLTNLISNTYARVMSGELDEKLVLSKSIKSNLDDYKNQTIPHVRAAKKIIEKQGQISDFKVSYVYVDSNVVEPVLDGEPFPKMTEAGRQRMWDREVFSQLERILNSIDMTYGKTTFDRAQKSLESFFVG